MIIQEQKLNILPAVSAIHAQPSPPLIKNIWHNGGSSNKFRSSTVDSMADPSEEKLSHETFDFYKENYAFEKLHPGVVTKADVPKNNVVDLDRIARGLDTRTTLMLRNIPNKVDQQMLKEYMDVTSENTYDFLCKF